MRDVERLATRPGDLGLHLEHVGDPGVERLLPLRRPPVATSTSSGLTWTRLLPSLPLIQRTVPVSR